MDWAKKFSNLGLKCGELTSDNDLPIQEVAQLDIILTTPEKYNSLTIKSFDRFQTLTNVGLIMIDEVHILHEDRGPVLEGLVSRFKRMKKKMEDLVEHTTDPNSGKKVRDRLRARLSSLTSQTVSVL